jgi:exosortase E/protease (VPEID-CTERM system)
MALESVRLSLHDRVQAQLARHGSFGLLQRLIALAALFVAEMLLLSVWLDNAALILQGGLVGLVGEGGAWAVRGVVGFVAVFVTFACLKDSAALAEISAEAEPASARPGFLAAHIFAMAAFGWLSWALYGNRLSAPPGFAVSLWLILGAAGFGFGVCWLIPVRIWLRLFRETGWLWAYSVLAVVVACVVGDYIRVLWAPAARLTFVLVKSFLNPFVSGIVADRASMTLGTAKFNVVIAPECSGFEGVGLILAFSVGWLLFFRRECRFPQALVLIPAGVATIFLLNAVRIAALILIGNAGAPEVALGGFHSQAGWIAFNAVALGFLLAATRVPWLMTSEAAERKLGRGAADAGWENPTMAYLLPFLSILAVGMVTTAASSDLEWLYPLRFVAAAGVLWVLRKRYRALDWRFSWFGLAIGGLVFAIWIAFDPSARGTTGDAMPQALAGSASLIRTDWIVFRILGAVVTVPIAEELAFRGFLLRRLVSEDFEAVPLRAFTWVGLGVSSVAFGLMHSHLWFAGTLAGLLYAWAMLRRGRIGEAVVAHATTNALLAVYVLAFHRWHLWM